MMLYQQGAGIKPDNLAVRMHANAKFAMIRLTDRDELFVNTTDEADALITAACEAKRLLLAKRKPADWCPAHTGPDDELDRAVYCDRQAGHPGSHRGAAGDGSEVAWPDAEPAPAELVALKQEMDPPVTGGCAETSDDGFICNGHDGDNHVAYGAGGGKVCARWPVAAPVPPVAGLIGQAVADAHDDSPVPATGTIVGQVDEETVEVQWDGTSSRMREPIDALRPVAS